MAVAISKPISSMLFNTSLDRDNEVNATLDMELLNPELASANDRNGGKGVSRIAFSESSAK
jgi:hypothetical protein